MRRWSRHLARLLPWLLVLYVVLPACAPQSGWSVPPPDCEDVNSASFVQGLAAWSRAGGEDGRDAWGEGAGPDYDPRTQAEEDGLPVFHLYMSGSLPDDDDYRPARLVYRGRCYVAEVRYRGHTSLKFPKRSMTLDFDEGQTFDEPVLAGGFMGRRKVVLISPFNDNAYMRSRLAFEVWNRMSPDHVRVKAFSVVVYLNGRYHGLFTVADHIDRHFLAGQGMDPGGELFKAVGLDANFSRISAEGVPKVRLRQGYEKKEGEPEVGDEAYGAIEALTAFVADSSPEQFRAERGAWMDTRDYDDWWIFALLAYTKDSVAKNAYHFRARGHGARWRFIPWDLDASFGQHWNTQRLDANELYSFTNENHLFARLMEDPAISGPLHARFRELLKGPLHRDVVLGLIDGYARELEAAALKDEARWGAEYRAFPRWSWRTDLNDFAGEVAYLRAWVELRWTALEQVLR
ncbi:CotH kinase family protein [Myxococcus sp. RHSTA-1-4]|uniref:CotH kinase family protein n=1 Tax=Myxococcus sp. RHSTA-1-4 TaxID=2874601 RepID=UPI001CBFC161|nr:CotH kinase family protein [Myxococcus sp. RHSTA-1-4]MBZ4419074.1 CotH kinase family protein [Myxococcus sp. RHSTA-1-4]